MPRYKNEPGEHYTWIPKATAESGPAAATAKALLEEFEQSEERASFSLLRKILREISERESPDALMEEFKSLRLRHRRLMKRWKELQEVRTRNVNKAQKAGQFFPTRAEAEKEETARQRAEEAEARAQEISDEIDQVRDRMREIFSRLQRDFFPVKILERTPEGLELPPDRREQNPKVSKLEIAF